MSSPLSLPKTGLGDATPPSLANALPRLSRQHRDRSGGSGPRLGRGRGRGLSRPHPWPDATSREAGPELVRAGQSGSAAGFRSDCHLLLPSGAWEGTGVPRPAEPPQQLAVAISDTREGGVSRHVSSRPARHVPVATPTGATPADGGAAARGAVRAACPPDDLTSPPGSPHRPPRAGSSVGGLGGGCRGRRPGPVAAAVSGSRAAPAPCQRHRSSRSAERAVSSAGKGAAPAAAVRASARLPGGPCAGSLAVT